MQTNRVVGDGWPVLWGKALDLDGSVLFAALTGALGDATTTGQASAVGTARGQGIALGGRAGAACFAVCAMQTCIRTSGGTVSGDGGQNIAGGTCATHHRGTIFLAEFAGFGTTSEGLGRTNPDGLVFFETRITRFAVAAIAVQTETDAAQRNTGRAVTKQPGSETIAVVFARYRTATQ